LLKRKSEKLDPTLDPSKSTLLSEEVFTTIQSTTLLLTVKFPLPGVGVVDVV
jgi:hypothetical protein